MTSRWFNVTVVLFWLTTMGWLVTQKIWPALERGEPPVARLDEPASRWDLFINEQPLGWATSETRLADDAVTELVSQVYVSHLPLEHFAPAWLLRMIDEPLTNTPMTADNTMQLDSLGQLIGFHSSVALGPLEDVFTIDGLLDGNRLNISVRTGELHYRTETYLSGGAMARDALAPRSNLGDLRVGRRWTAPVYSPFRPPNSPLEIVQAVVEREEPIIWNGAIVATRVVVLRTDPGSGIGDGGQVRGQMWVAKNGTVLKQEAALLNSRLTFVRVPPGAETNNPGAEEAAP